jgi:hypothetical protein
MSKFYTFSTNIYKLSIIENHRIKQFQSLCYFCAFEKAGLIHSRVGAEAAGAESKFLPGVVSNTDLEVFFT